MPEGYFSHHRISHLDIDTFSIKDLVCKIQVHILTSESYDNQHILKTEIRSRVTSECFGRAFRTAGFQIRTPIFDKNVNF